MSLCKFKDIFGKPGQGVHEKRFMGLAAFDLFGTILIAVLIAYSLDASFIIVFFIIFVLGELLHLLFCVDTAFIKLFD